MTGSANDMITGSPVIELGTEPGETAARRVERAIRKAIVTLELPPGCALSEKDLADRCGISRQPVREAFIALARAGLVTIQPRRGTFVTKISTEHLRQGRFIRESLEIAVVRAACAAFDSGVRCEIDAILARQAVHADAQDHIAFQREDDQFHAALAEGSGFRTAWVVIEDIKAHMDRVCYLTLRPHEAAPSLIAQHHEIVAAIDARNPDAAERAIRRHLAEILKAMPQVERMYSDLFA
ncbi:MAG: GntR family transcriptional regulator [Azospirillaceae bacterium]|nr:GntR family transcriptional regulator [Azospirillaceae bacterium]